MSVCAALKSSMTFVSTATCVGRSPVPRQQYQRISVDARPLPGRRRPASGPVSPTALALAAGDCRIRRRRASPKRHWYRGRRRSGGRRSRRRRSRRVVRRRRTLLPAASPLRLRSLEPGCLHRSPLGWAVDGAADSRCVDRSCLLSGGEAGDSMAGSSSWLASADVDDAFDEVAGAVAAHVGAAKLDRRAVDRCRRSPSTSNAGTRGFMASSEASRLRSSTGSNVSRVRADGDAVARGQDPYSDWCSRSLASSPGKRSAGRCTCSSSNGSPSASRRRSMKRVGSADFELQPGRDGLVGCLRASRDQACLAGRGRGAAISSVKVIGSSRSRSMRGGSTNVPRPRVRSMRCSRAARRARGER